MCENPSSKTRQKYLQRAEIECNIQFVRSYFFLISLVLCTGAIVFCGCTTVTVYQSPVVQFQTAVNSANDGVRTYLLGVNDVIAKGNIYDKVRTAGSPDWVAKDLESGIPANEIQLRLQALGTISTYANALGAMAESKDVANLAQAAKALGDNVNSLSTTIANNMHGKDPMASALGGPITSLVTFFGTIGIEHAQKAALEKAIVDGSTNVDAIIDCLKVDLPKFSVLIDTSENAIWQGKLKIYNDLRKSASPKDLDSLINQFIADYDSVEQLRQAQVTSLLANMEIAHKALVIFAKSSKSPKDLSDLAGQINTFSANVQLFNAALASIQTAIKTSK